MKQKKNRKGIHKDIMYCPYCGGRTELRSADGIYHDKSLVGSAASGEGLVNVYRGTGKVLLAPVTKGFA